MPSGNRTEMSETSYMVRLQKNRLLAVAFATIRNM